MNGDRTQYPWRWRLACLLRGLTTERQCLAHTIKGCWLVEELDSWNRALRAARLILTEFEPGKLRLCSYDDRVHCQPKRDSGENVNDGAFLAAWLPRQHSCICDVRVYDRAHFDQLSFISPVVVGPRTNLQCLVLHPRYSRRPGIGFLRAFGPPQSLCQLDLTNVDMTDVIATDVAEVLRENASTLRSVKFVGNTMTPEAASVLHSGLASCEWLKDLTIEDSIRVSACDSMAGLIRRCKVIEKLSLVGLCDAGVRCKHSGLARGLRICLDCLTDLFTALEGALLLKHLALENTSIGTTMAQALAEFLRRHHSLQKLSLIDCTFDIAGTTYIAEALSGNSSLEYISLHKCSLDAETLSKLCSALHVSTTPRKLFLPKIKDSSPVIQERNPTLELLRLYCPDRIQFCLFVNQPSLVSKALTQALVCAPMAKVYHGRSGAAVIRSLYASLALNHSLRSLRIDYRSVGTANDDGVSGALCTALRAIIHLETFHLDVHKAFNNSEQTAHLLNDVFNALNPSPCLRKLSLVTSHLTFKTAEALSVLVAQCRMSLVELHIVTTDMSDAVLGVLRNMVKKNVFLVKLSVKCTAWKDVILASAAIDDAKEQNQGLLNNAARFVMNIDAGPAASGQRNCAAAFEELCATASFREHLAALSGKTGLELSSDVKRAWCYLQDNYMVIAGIVCTAVVCEGNGGMQLNALNGDCWRAIVRYLKLSDVVH